MTGFFRTHAHPSFELQRTADVAVVIPTVLRPSLADALRCIFAQSFSGRIQILVGVDVANGDPAVLDVAADHPPNCAVQLFHPGYSTSRRHGGLNAAGDGGVLRSVLSLLANSPLVAYLDDDNWWSPMHLAQMRAAIEDVGYSYALRWYVHPDTGRPVCLDEWESVGPDQGVYKHSFGGFIDPSCLMIDKRRCGDVIDLWRKPMPGDPRAQSADRTVFRALRSFHRGRSTGSATVFYRLDAKDGNHAARLGWMGTAYQRAGADCADSNGGPLGF